MNGKETIVIEGILSEVSGMKILEEKRLKEIQTVKSPHNENILSKDTLECLGKEEEKIKRSINVLSEAHTRIIMIAGNYGYEK